MKLPGGPRLWVTLASAGFLLAAFVGHARQIQQLRLDSQGFFWLILGVGLSMVSLMANGFAWGVTLTWLGHQPRWSAVIQLFLTSNLRKYLPGGVWHLLARIRALSGHGTLPLQHPLTTSQALVAVFVDPLLMTVAGLVLVPLGGWQGGLALLGPLALLILVPRWLSALVQRIKRRRSRQLIDPQLLQEDPPPSDPDQRGLPHYPLRPLGAELIFVLLRFAGFACCVQAFDLAYALSWGGWLAGFALAWTAGVVVPGAPGGLGVFEAVLLLRLAYAVPEAPLLAVAISYRLITAVADLLAASTAQADARFWRARSEG
jgi:glycosyltransferase 2 family protein